jgi:hypothetical protein
MPVTVTCPNCATKLKAPDSAVGRKVKCPKCEGVIAVPTAHVEPVDRARRGVQAEPPDPVPYPASPSRRRRQDDDEDNDRPLSRRRREEDYEDDYDDDRGPSRREPAQGGGLPMGLGIASLSVGVLGLLIALIPCVGAFGWPICAVGLVLGVVGLFLGISKGNAIAFPIAGSAVSGVALAISLMWVFLIARTAQMGNQMGKGFAREMERAAKEAQAAAQQAQAAQQQVGIAKQIQNGMKPLPGVPTPPTGSITLAAGKARLEAELTVADPRDRVMAGSACKVYTLKMKAGRTYQIDMMQKPGAPGLDPFLRLEDSQGKQLADDDDGGGGLNGLDARIVFACTQDGTYRVVATTLEPQTGGFALSVEERQ